MKEYMIQIGTTDSGNIIEVPDIAIAALGILFIVTIFTLASKNGEMK